MHSSKNCPRTHYGDTTGTKMKEYNCYLLDLQGSRKCVYFPGGKMEPGETPEEALVREIREELSADIQVGKLLYTVEWDYPQFHLTMHCYMCTLVQDALHLNEHEAARWLSMADLHSVNWLPADEMLLPLIGQEMNQSYKSVDNQ